MFSKHSRMSDECRCIRLKSSYSRSCSGLSSHSRSCVILGGRSVSTSSLTRRNRNGSTCRCSASIASAPASCSLGELFGSRLARIGRLNRVLNCFSVPRKPGIRKSKSDHSSSTLFWIGVPDRMSRWLATSCLIAFELFVRPFLMMWPSSIVPVDRAEELDILAHDVVRRDDQVVGAELLAQLLPVARQPDIVQRPEEPARQELLHLVHPVAGEGRRADDDARQLGAAAIEAALVMVGRQYADRLQRLPEPHVVAQDAVQLVAVEEPEPVHARLLIAAQLRIDLDRQLNVRYRFGREQILQEAAVLHLALAQIVGQVAPAGPAVSGRPEAVQRHQLDERREAVRRHEPHRLVRVAHAPEQRHDQQHHMAVVSVFSVCSVERRTDELQWLRKGHSRGTSMDIGSIWIQLEADGRLRMEASSPMKLLQADASSSWSSSRSHSSFTMCDTCARLSSFGSQVAIGMRVEAATAPTSSTASNSPVSTSLMITGRNVWIRSSRTTSMYLMPSRPPCRTSHSFCFTNVSRMATVWCTLASGSWRSTVPSTWAHVSRTGATTWSDTKSPKRSRASTHSSRSVASSSHS
uniref:Uncharacterized protein n=1 Tax=Anopheles coluzzii TaxID=1518534 RepID=A0A8W7P2V1_ANOCL